VAFIFLGGKAMPLVKSKKKIKVLVVEDNKVDRRLLQGMLSKSTHGTFEIETAESMAKAIELLNKHKFDVALLDLNLPDSRGLETLRKLNKEFLHLPIVVNTGAYEDEIGLKAVTRGAQDYLIKGKYETYGLSKALFYAIERKKAEEELAKAYEQFRETQTQLIQVEKMNVIGSLASGVAHEVKNPLATIMYGVEFLYTKLETKDPQISFTLDSIRDATRRSNDIIKDLLDFSSLSKLQMMPEDFNKVIDQGLSLIKHQISKQKVEVIKNFSVTLPHVRIDPNRMEQVLLDLILNALHAMPNGGNLTITTASQKFSARHIDAEIVQSSAGRFKEGDVLVIVDIDDTGVGIPEEYLGKIFDPFFTTRRAAGGVGLGLSIARTIVKNHGGVIYIQNRQGGGVRARLVFRAATKEEKGGKD
jgi:signal transduction histidine kinase